MVEAMRLLKEHEMDPDDMGFSPDKSGKADPDGSSRRDQPYSSKDRI